jgi:Transglutaminase-like superfamily
MSAAFPAPRRLSPAEKARLVLEVLRAYREVRSLAGSATLPEVVAQLRSASDGTRPRDDDYLEAIRLGSVVGRVLRALPVDSRCLTRSLVLTRLLAARGMTSTLVIGVRPGESFGAHAWVERGGNPLLPAGNGEFERLVEL